MAGHRRQVSNSTVATVDMARTKWLPETAVLKPVPPKMLPHSDAWPCFVLKDATVYLKDGKRMANPLLPDFPFVVRGTLEVDEVDEKEAAQRKSLLHPGLRSAHIEIQGATMYSISYGPLAVWVGGACGWYEISPSPQFQKIYNEMREAVTLYYEILTVFESHEAAVAEHRAMPKNKRKRIREPSIGLDDVLLKYAVAVGDGMYRHEAEERCHKWAAFLINHFPKESEFTWSGTFFYTWIIDKHPDIYRKFLKRLAEEERLKKGTVSKASTHRQSLQPPSRAPSVEPQPWNARSRKISLDVDVDMNDVSSTSSVPPRRSSSRRAKASQSPVGTPKSLSQARSALPQKSSLETDVEMESVQPSPRAAQNLSPAGADPSTPSAEELSPIDTLIEALEEIAAGYTRPISEIARSTVHSRLYYGFRISNYNASAEIIGFYSKELVQRLDPKWHPSPFWRWLEGEAKKTSRELLHTDPEKIPSQLIRRQRKQPATPSTTPASALPPRLQIRSKAPQASDDGLTSEDDLLLSRPRHAGKGGLRLHSASKKRTAAQMLDNDDEASSASGRRGRKSAKTAHYPEEEEAAAAAADSDSSDSDSDSDGASAAQADSDDDADADANPDGHLAVPPPKDAVRVVVHAEKLPSLSPSGPDGTWVCDQAGCGYVVRAAEEAAGARLIQQHFRDHEARTEKVALALTEAGRSGGRMPINHLLEKIQSMGKDSLFKEREVINGEDVPLPIKRRLIV